MTPLDRRLTILRRMRPEERLAALDATLAQVAPAEREPLAILLIELAAPGGASPELARLRLLATRTLALHWAEAPLPLRRLALAACRGCWGRALEGADVHGLPAPALRSLADLAIDSGDPSLTPFLAGGLESPEASAATASAQALLAQAVRLAGEDDAALLGLERSCDALRCVLDPEAAQWSGAEFRELLAAIARGVDTFDTHRRKELLLAALVLLQRPCARGPHAAPLHQLVADRESAAGRALRSALRRARAPIARRRAWHWLRETSVAAACAERVARAPTVADHAALLAEAHLALSPLRQSRLRMLPIATRPAPAGSAPPGLNGAVRRLHPEGPAPDRVALQLLGFVARRQAPRLVACLDADEATRDLALDPFLLDPDPLARLAAARVVSPGAVRDFCFDGCEAVARHAAISAGACGVSESARLRAGDAHRRRFAAALARSPHPSVRRIGGEERDRLAPGASNAAQALAARRAWAADASSFVDWVRDTVRGGDERAAVGALMTCRRIAAVPAVEPLVLAIVRDSFAAPAPSARLAATAVACLGDLRTARVVEVLAECMERHPDARVRANAAEAVGRCGRAARLAGGLGEEHHHRVRASVLRSLLAPWPEPKPAPMAAGAAEALGRMLLDERGDHRLAGVWVLQRSLSAGMRGHLGRRWEELSTRVRWLADGDHDGRVRARAARVVERLDAAVAGIGPRPAGSIAP